MGEVKFGTCAALPVVLKIVPLYNFDAAHQPLGRCPFPFSHYARRALPLSHFTQIWRIVMPLPNSLIFINQVITMKIIYMVLGPFMTNTYIAYNEETMDGIVVDPSFSPEQYIHALQDKKIHLRSILLTHGHVDHMAGMNALRKAFPEAKMYMDKRDQKWLRSPERNLSYMFPNPVIVDDADVWVKDGDTIDTCGFSFRVIDTAGHTPGGISFYEKKGGFVFTGDSLFQGSIGRTDFPGGDLKELVGNIRKNLFALPDSTVVLSGHGNQTTIGEEKRTNPFLNGGDL